MLERGEPSVALCAGSEVLAGLPAHSNVISSVVT